MTPLDQFESNVRAGIPSAVVINPKKRPPLEALVFPAGTFRTPPLPEAANERSN